MKLPRERALLFNSKCCIETKFSAQTSCSARKGETDHESEKEKQWSYASAAPSRRGTHLSRSAHHIQYSRPAVLMYNQYNFGARG